MADSVYGIVWVSGLLMSTLWIEWPVMAVGLWYGQVYVMDNKHRCILLMAFWMHRDTVTRSWGPARPHVARICTQFLEAENIPILAWPAYAPDMSPIEHVWDALDRRIRQRVPVSANIQQLHTAIKEEWTNIPQSTTGSTLCKGDVLHCVRQMVVTPDTYWFSGAKISVAFIILFIVYMLTTD